MEQPGLGNDTRDYLAIAGKGVAGCLPFVGGLVAEILGAAIPKQRVDRIAAYLRILEARLESLEKELAAKRLASTEGTALLEDSLLLAYRSRTDERRQQIASIVVGGISGQSMRVSEAQRLLSILGELNDAEVIVLQAYALRWFTNQSFFRPNSRLLFPETPVLADPQQQRDDYAIRMSYDDHLEQLGLIARELKIEKGHNGEPSIARKKRGEITRLGLALVRSIGGQTLE